MSLPVGFGISSGNCHIATDDVFVYLWLRLSSFPTIKAAMLFVYRVEM